MQRNQRISSRSAIPTREQLASRERECTWKTSGDEDRLTITSIIRRRTAKLFRENLGWRPKSLRLFAYTDLNSVCYNSITEQGQMFWIAAVRGAGMEASFTCCPCCPFLPEFR